MEGSQQLNSIARTVYDEMSSFYSNPKNKAAFEKWKAEKDKKRKNCENQMMKAVGQ